MSVAAQIATYAFLIFFLILAAAPFYWTLVSSFRSMGEIFSRPTFLPSRFTLENYVSLSGKTLFWRWTFNSFFVAIGYTLLGLFFCSLGGFGFAKYTFPFRDILFWILLGSMMIPYHVTIVPLFSVFSKLGLVNTYWSLIVPGSANAFGIFFMRQYISGIPTDLMDAARIDGCSDFVIYHRIILPIIKPGIGALAIFLFLGSWNNFLSPLIFMRTSEMFTLPVGLAALFGQWKVEYGQIMAGSVFTVLPVVVVFLSLQRQFIEGLTVGSLKG
ncbi:MAG TPA: carbohydrate ABC transporter permease [Firmicutes bacterium]|nr:carbohydrate ABC transporter permease [Bacillota bacterium]